MWAIPTGTSSVLKKKNQVKSPSPESRVLETGSDPPIGSGRGSGRDTMGVLPIDIIVGSKTSLSAFFVINSTVNYNVLLGRDWTHAN